MNSKYETARLEDVKAAMLAVRDAQIAEQRAKILSGESVVEMDAMLPVYDAGYARARAEQQSAREALEQIQLLASNHSGWVENDAVTGVFKIYDIASQAINQLTQGAQG